jgi:hypothetical protein
VIDALLDALLSLLKAALEQVDTASEQGRQAELTSRVDKPNRQTDLTGAPDRRT